ncbi:MAG TPA: TetR/AcrR family transcriptional regulator [Solirubrobacteraceae bacterium]|jgi:AcrR family transcriptional regulator|nr:TetR/AcrR family transcriptional regulator [Solirubrobacteraceae bacterium]
MAVPVEAPAWATLDPAAKRERLLRVAGEVFAREGLDAPMPVIAAAAGAGVGSVYRQFPSKRELLAALVIDRLNDIAETARTAAGEPGDNWSALLSMLWSLVERQAGDDLLGQAMLVLSDHPEVAQAADRALGALGELLAGARTEGRLRADASTDDLRLLFAATRASKQIDPDAWRRMLQLLIDALAA